ncbi:MAG: ABC transporter ATP-binding protein [Clostridia bacterium]|nr:ABC transporter ATP-binding protein [Clostridia bacterium]
MKETFTNIKKVYQYGKEYKKNLIMLILGTLSGAIVGVVLPLLTAKQIVYFTSDTVEQVIGVSLVILLVQAYRAFAALFFVRRNSQRFRRGTMKNIQIELGKEVLKISQTDMDSNSSGMFIQRVTNDTEKISDFFWEGLNSLRNILANVGSLFAIFIINFQAFLYYLFVSIVLTLIHIIKTNKYGKKDREYRDKTENVSGLIGELVRGTRDIKMLNAKSSFMTTLEQNIDMQNQKRFEMAGINAKYTYIIDTLKAIFEFGLILLLVLLIKNNIISVAIAIALFNYKSGIMTILMEKVSKLMELAKNFNISCDRVFSILDNKTFEKEKFGNKHLEKVYGNFEFKNVNFGYDEEKLILDNINFKINSGEMVGFVGKSGAGKTTIFNLLCKMYSIKSGEILIEDENINELDEQSIRGNITIISQNPYVFNLSIRDNLKLVKEELIEEEMREACRIACLDDFIESLPNKYDTILGEGGVILSGGQKQRLAIARAFVQKTKIILFDEATSSLDNETQAKIQKAISNLKDEYTILIIAHRLSTIVNCDKIMLLEEGKINDTGTHEELLSRNNLYQKLYQTEILQQT